MLRRRPVGPCFIGVMMANAKTCDARYVFDKPHLPPDSKRRDLAITMVGSTSVGDGFGIP